MHANATSAWPWLPTGGQIDRDQLISCDREYMDMGTARATGDGQ